MLNNLSLCLSISLCMSTGLCSIAAMEQKEPSGSKINSSHPTIIMTEEGMKVAPTSGGTKKRDCDDNRDINLSSLKKPHLANDSKHKLERQNYEAVRDNPDAPAAYKERAQQQLDKLAQEQRAQAQAKTSVQLIPANHMANTINNHLPLSNDTNGIGTFSRPVLTPIQLAPFQPIPGNVP